MCWVAIPPVPTKQRLVNVSLQKKGTRKGPFPGGFRVALVINLSKVDLQGAVARVFLDCEQQATQSSVHLGWPIL